MATLNTVAMFYLCIGNTTGILTDNLLVATYALSCLCIPVSNAVVEWVVSQGRYEGEQAGHFFPSANSLWRRRKVPTISQVCSRHILVCTY